MVRRVAVLATVRTWVSLRTLQEQTIIGSPLAQIPMSASSQKADIHHDDGDVRFVPEADIGLERSPPTEAALFFRFADFRQALKLVRQSCPTT